MTCDIAMSGVNYGLWSRSQLKSNDQDYSNRQNDLTTFAKVLNWNILKILIKNPKYEIAQKSVHWEFKLFHAETDRLACITRLAVITCFVNKSNKMKHNTL
jgi:hypothetical protein